jgi:hypothetical protein
LSTISLWYRSNKSTMSTSGKTSSKEKADTPTSDKIDKSDDVKHKGPDVKVPDTYDGNRSKLQSFLTQCELHMLFNATKFRSETEQVLFVVSLLRGAAYN